MCRVGRRHQRGTSAWHSSGAGQLLSRAAPAHAMRRLAGRPGVAAAEQVAQRCAVPAAPAGRGHGKNLRQGAEVGMRIQCPGSVSRRQRRPAGRALHIACCRPAGSHTHRRRRLTCAGNDKEPAVPGDRLWQRQVRGPSIGPASVVISPKSGVERARAARPARAASLAPRAAKPTPCSDQRRATTVLQAAPAGLTPGRSSRRCRRACRPATQ